MAVAQEAAHNWGEITPPDALSSWFAERFPAVPVIYPDNSLLTHPDKVMEMTGVYDAMNPLEQMSVRLSLAARMRGTNRTDSLYDATIFGSVIGSSEVADACIHLIETDRMPDSRGPIDVKVWAIGLIGQHAEHEGVFRTLDKWFHDANFDPRYKGQIATELVRVHPESFTDVIGTVIELTDPKGGSKKAEFEFATLMHAVGEKQYRELILALPQELLDRYHKLCQVYKLPLVIREDPEPEKFQKANVLFTHKIPPMRNKMHHIRQFD